MNRLGLAGGVIVAFVSVGCGSDDAPTTPTAVAPAPYEVATTPPAPAGFAAQGDSPSCTMQRPTVSLHPRLWYGSDRVATPAVHIDLQFPEPCLRIARSAGGKKFAIESQMRQKVSGTWGAWGAWEVQRQTSFSHLDWAIRYLGSQLKILTVPLWTDAGISFEFRIRLSIDDVAYPPTSAISEWIGPPGKPTGVVATLAEDGRLIVTWNPYPKTWRVNEWFISARNSHGHGVLHGAIKDAEDSIKTRYVFPALRASLAGETLSVRVQGRSRTASGLWSPKSDPVYVTVEVPDGPGQPIIDRAAAGHGEVTLTWRDPADDSITGYERRHRLAAGGEWTAWTAIAGSDADTTSHTFSGLTNGSLYEFEVRAVSSGTAGPASTTIEWPAGAAPGTPEQPGITAATEGDGTVTLTWRDPADDSITGYEQRRRRVGRGELWYPWTAIAGSDADTTSHTFSGLTNGILYEFEVRAKNPAGAGPASTTIKWRPRAPR